MTSFLFPAAAAAAAAAAANITSHHQVGSLSGLPLLQAVSIQEFLRNLPNLVKMFQALLLSSPLRLAEGYLKIANSFESTWRLDNLKLFKGPYSISSALHKRETFFGHFHNLIASFSEIGVQKITQ